MIYHTLKFVICPLKFRFSVREQLHQNICFCMLIFSIQGVPKKCNPPVFPIFFQNSLSYIKNDSMVEETNILEITYPSFKQIRSSKTKL